MPVIVPIGTAELLTAGADRAGFVEITVGGAATGRLTTAEPAVTDIVIMVDTEPTPEIPWALERLDALAVSRAATWWRLTMRGLGPSPFATSGGGASLGSTTGTSAGGEGSAIGGVNGRSDGVLPVTAAMGGVTGATGAVAGVSCITIGTDMMVAGTGTARATVLIESGAVTASGGFAAAPLLTEEG